MFITKFWSFILAVIVAFLVGIIYLVPSSVNESKVTNVRVLILKDRLQLESILKMEARNRLDTLSVFSVDQTIREQLALVNQRKDSTQIPIEVKEKLLSRLRTLNEKLATFRADMLIAVDSNGIVIAQVGEGERSSGYSLKGFPVVQAVLRGYVRDDSWFFDGKLYRIAARPVIHSGSYVGAIIHGQKMDKSFTQILANATDSQVGIFVEDHLVSLSVPGEELQGGKKTPGNKVVDEVQYASDAQINTILVDEVFKDKKYKETGRSEIILSKLQFFCVAFKMVGEARQNNAGFVLVRQVPKVEGLQAFLKSIKKEELSGVPWWQIATIAILLAVVGILIVFLEGDRPKSKFLKEVDKMVSKEGERLNIYLFRGKWRKLADSINRAIDKAVQVIVTKSTSEIPSVSRILGAPLKDDRLSKPAFEIPTQISLDEIPPPPPEPPKVQKREKAPTASSLKPVQSVQSAAPAKSSPPVSPPAPPAPAPAPQPIVKQQAPSPPPAKPAVLDSWGGGVDEEETRVYEGDKGVAFSGVPVVPEDSKSRQKPGVSAGGTPSSSVVGSKEDEEYKRIFDEFYKTKISCGEKVDNLTFERFKATLQKQEQSIIEKTRCKRVEFKVYVKDGKAALKATPVDK